MEHTYRKTATIKAEPFDESPEMMKKYNIQYGDTGLGYEYYLPTKEGDMVLAEGDYIATGVQGEHWAIESSIFDATYERID